MELIGDNVYMKTLVKFGPNPPSRYRAIAKTSSTNQVPDQLINMRRIFKQNLSIIEIIHDNVDTSPLVKFGQNSPRHSRVIVKTSSTNQVPDQLINMRRICR
jgi:hypothetical protein